MTVDEAGDILRVMQAAWPRFAETTDSAGLWIDRISQSPLDVGREVARLLVERAEFAPSIAGWEDTRREVARRAAVEANNRERKALDMPKAHAAEERIAAMLREAREKVRLGREELARKQRVGFFRRSKKEQR